MRSLCQNSLWAVGPFLSVFFKPNSISVFDFLLRRALNQIIYQRDLMADFCKRSFRRITSGRSCLPTVTLYRKVIQDQFPRKERVLEYGFICILEPLVESINQHQFPASLLLSGWQCLARPPFFITVDLSFLFRPERGESPVETQRAILLIP